MSLRELIGVHEILFLAGLAGLFAGLSGLWSVYGALAVTGAVLILVAIIGAVRASARKEG